MEKRPPSKRRAHIRAEPDLPLGEYTIDQISELTNTTVRNIRAYQDKGVLPMPEKRGRQAIYQEIHVSRLRLINNLLDRGFSIGNINELLEAWKQGRELSDLLGLEDAISRGFTSEPPKTYTLPDLLKRFGLAATRKRLIEQATQLGLIQRKGTKFVSDSPRIIEAGTKLVALGMPFEELLEVVRLLRGNVQRAADNLVNIAFDRFDVYGDDLPPDNEVNDLSELIWELRPLALSAIQAEAELALNRALQKRLGDKLSRVIEHIHQD